MKKTPHPFLLLCADEDQQIPNQISLKLGPDKAALVVAVIFCSSFFAIATGITKIVGVNFRENNNGIPVSLTEMLRQIDHIFWVAVD